jgi:hypothetical protein
MAPPRMQLAQILEKMTNSYDVIMVLDLHLA